MTRAPPLARQPRRGPRAARRRPRSRWWRRAARSPPASPAEAADAGEWEHIPAARAAAAIGLCRLALASAAFGAMIRMRHTPGVPHAPAEPERSVADRGDDLVLRAESVGPTVMH